MLERVSSRILSLLKQTESERQYSFDSIDYQVRETFQEYPDAKCALFGSMATGLAIDSSDMDILVQGIPQLSERQCLVDHMRRLHQ